MCIRDRYWPTPYLTAQFRSIFAHSASTVKASEKSSISANRKSTTRFPTSHRWTVYVTLKSPKGLHKTRFWCLLQWNSTSVKKFLCVKTYSGKVVATSFLYLTVHRRIAGDDPIYQKFALRVTHLSIKNADFDRFRSIVPQPWELERKVQLSLIGSRQCAFHRAIDEPCYFPVNFNFCRKKVCCKVSSSENFQCKVVATSFLYP